MPVVVDGAQRRLNVVREAASLVVDGGLAALTFRNLAKALGCSTTVVSHYFTDKADLLIATYRYVIDQSMARRDRRLEETGGDLLSALEELLPAHLEQRRHWVVWLSFWNAALFDAELHQEHRLGLTGTRERLRDHLAARGCEEAEDAAGAICNALFGISVQALFDEVYWTPERQRGAFRKAVAAAVTRSAA